MLWTCMYSYCQRNSGSVRDENMSSGEDEGTVDPNVVAQTYWHLHIQDWTAWTQEMDMRSNAATFFWAFKFVQFPFLMCHFLQIVL